MKKCISLILSFVLTISVFGSAAFCVDAAESATSQSSFRRCIINMSRDSDVVTPSSVSRNTDVIKTGDSTRKWAKHTSNAYVTFKPLVSNWSGYKALEFWLYSEKATNLDRRIIFYNKTDESTGQTPYFSYKFNVNWIGWKHFYIEKSEMGEGRYSPSWKSIDIVNFTATGWNLVADSDTTLYIDNFFGISQDNPEYTHFDKCIADWSLQSSFDAQVCETLKNSKEYTGYAPANIHWSDTVTANTLVIPDCPRDWTEYEYIQFRMHSAKATGQTIMMHFYSPKSDAGLRYYTYSIQIDWTGWKLFTVKLSELSGTRNPSWSDIENVRVESTGWSMAPVKDTDIYFDNIYLLKPVDGMEIQYYGEKDKSSHIAFDVSKDAHFSANPHCNLVESAEQHRSKATSALFDASKYTSCSFLFDTSYRDWSNYDTLDFYVYASKKGGSIDLSLYGLDNNKKNISSNPYMYNVDWTGWKHIRYKINNSWYSDGNNVHYMYKPAINGVNFSTGNGGKIYFDCLCAVSSETDYNVDTNFIPPAYTNAVLNNYIKYNGGDEETNDLSNADIKSKIASVDKTAKTCLDTVNLGGGDLWENSSTIDKKVDTFSKNINSIATAYATYGSAYYQDKSTLTTIKKCLDIFCSKFYGQNIVDERGGANNWYYWCLSVPYKLGSALSAIYPNLSSDEKTKYSYCACYMCAPEWCNGSNLAYMTTAQIVLSALRNDAERLLYYRKLGDEIYYFGDSPEAVNGNSATVNGFLNDDSYKFHDNYLHTWSYGANHYGLSIQRMYLLNNTVFKLDENKMENVYHWTIETFDPLTHGMFSMSIGHGRAIKAGASNAGGKESSSFTSYCSNVANLSQLFTGKKQQTLYSLLKKYCHYTDYATSCNLNTMSVVQKIRDGEIDVSVYDRNGYSKLYSLTDKFVQHSLKGYSAALSMNSARTAVYDCINGENVEGWYQQYGVLYVYTDYKSDQYNTNFWRYGDHYKMPGTTLTTQTRNKIDGEIIKTGNNFTGGTVSGEYAAIGYRTAPYTIDKVWGDDFSTTLDTHQSYFFFDNEIVCLGSDIKCSDGYETRTIVENRASQAKTEFRLNNNITTLTDNVETVKSGVKSAYLSSMGGYVFPDSGKNLNLRKYVNGGKTFYEMWYSHGVNPTNGKYSYIELPKATADETDAYAANPDVNIIRNDTNVQAVTEKNTGATGYIFWFPDTCGNVSASTYCSAMIVQKDGKLKISVSDPRQLEDSVTLTVNNLPKGYSLSSKDSKVTTSVSGSTITLTANTKGAQGKTFTAEYTFTGTSVVTLDSQSATTKGTTSVSIAAGSILPNITVPTKTDFYFDGYFTQKNGAGTRIYNHDGISNYVATEATQTAYANWKPMGDADDNGTVTSADALLILQQSVDLVELSGINAALADINNDAKIDAIDALLTLKKSIS